LRADNDAALAKQQQEEEQQMKENIDKVNQLYDDGHTIVYWTARGSGSGIDWREVTEKQFKKWGVKYHKLILKKPLYNVFIDDRNINTDNFFDNFDSYREDYLKQVEDNIIQLEDINH
jgi:hypothetical protein